MHRAAFRAGDRIVVKIVELCAARGAEAFRAELWFRHGQKSLRQVESRPPLGGLRARIAPTHKSLVRSEETGSLQSSADLRYVGRRIPNCEPPRRSAANNSRLPQITLKSLS